MSRMMTFLKEKILNRKENFISFYEYMNDCLYHPGLGYYMNQKQKIGKQGDFYTSSSVHPVFAQTIVDVVVDIFQRTGKEVHFCEMGAGTGSFAKQFLDYLQREYSAVYENATYSLIEKSGYHQEQQRNLLNEHMDHIRWVSDISEEGGFSGVFFSNELVDAFPVYLVEKQKGQLMEVGVGYSEREKCLIEVFHPLEHQGIINYLNQFNLNLKEGQRMEIPLDAVTWAKEVAEWIRDGIWLTIDYGHTNEELKSPERKRGSLLCYDQHQVDENLLIKPGEKDMTYHIHFDVLAETAQSHQWTKLGYYTQNDFLLRAGIVNKLEDNAGGDPFKNDTIRKNRAIRQFISPEGMSRSFHVLALGKGAFLDHSYPFLEAFSIENML
jgi:SAM-dependent MidA family methyltransferase